MMVRGLVNCPGARALRQAVFVQEQGFTQEFDDQDATAWHLLFTDAGRPVATARTYPKEGEPGTYFIGRVAVAREMRGRALGTKAIGCMEEQILSLGGAKAELSAQVQAQGFYEKLGYQSLGDLHLDEHCPHVSMVKTLKREYSNETSQ